MSRPRECATSLLMMNIKGRRSGCVERAGGARVARVIMCVVINIFLGTTKRLDGARRHKSNLSQYRTCQHHLHILCVPHLLLLLLLLSGLGFCVCRLQTRLPCRRRRLSRPCFVESRRPARTLKHLPRRTPAGESNGVSTRFTPKRRCRGDVVRPDPNKSQPSLSVSRSVLSPPFRPIPTGGAQFSPHPAKPFRTMHFLELTRRSRGTKTRTGK